MPIPYPSCQMYDSVFYSGNYTIKPKYAGKDVPGSPFKVTGEPQGDASKVKCTGPGLNKPHPGHAAPFEVDCTKAGKGLPNVQAKGPEGRCPLH